MLPPIPSVWKRLISYLVKCEWIKEELSLLSTAYVLQHDPYVINLLESSSSFPNGACLHFSHVRLGKWDILSLTGRFSAPQLTTLLHRCQLKPLLGHVGDQNFWVRANQENAASLSSPRTLPLLNSTPAGQPSSNEPAQNTGEGRIGYQHEAGLGSSLVRSSLRKRNLHFCDLFFHKIWELGRRSGLVVALESDPSSNIVSAIYLVMWLRRIAYYLNLSFLIRNHTCLV